MFVCSDKKNRTIPAELTLAKRGKRSPTLSKLRPPCPIFLSEQREQREQTFIINDLRSERRQTSSEHHEQTFIINDLRLTTFLLRPPRALDRIVKPRYALKIKSEHYEHEQLDRLRGRGWQSRNQVGRKPTLHPPPKTKLGLRTDAVTLSFAQMTFIFLKILTFP